VSEAEELRRVLPVVEALRRRAFPLPISVDTTKPGVARAALAAGADLVNDVSCLSDPALARAAAEAGAPLVLMHTRGTPADMASRAVYGDVVAEVARELDAALGRAEGAGLPRARVIVDPGIGFAKTAAQSLELLARLPELRALGRPLLLGPSRKSFIGAATGAPVGERLAGTLAAVTAAVLAGAEWVRVHDVAEARQAARVAAAIRDAGRGAARPPPR
jgi:dihydropteroate synthase